jgi:hypothetical protein
MKNVFGHGGSIARIIVSRGRGDLKWQELKEKTEKLNRPSEKLQRLISEVDGAAYPDEPLEVNIVSNPEEKKWEEGDTAVLSGHEDEAGGVKKWDYEINPGMDEEEEEDTLEMLLGIAIHEVRHRAIRKEGAPIEIIRNKQSLSELVVNYPALEKYGALIDENERLIAEKYVGKKSVVADEEEYDARAVEIIGKALMEEGQLSTREIAEEIIKADAEKMFANIDRRSSKL